MRWFFFFAISLSLSNSYAQVTEWSVVRDENILWKTMLPEGGQSAVTISEGRVFTTMHSQVEAGDPLTEPNIVGLCLDSKTGEILWEIQLPGTDPVQMAGIFSDATTFAPIVEGDKVWFFNRCGSMGCFEVATGDKIWLRTFLPRPRHTNRQCEPLLVGDLILTVEVKDKEAGQQMKRHKPAPEGIDPREVWTYLHAIDKNTGEIRWIGKPGTSIHNTPRVGEMADGTIAVAHGRGGGHGPLERPFGMSLTRVSDGETLWSTDLGRCEASFQSHWDQRFGYWWRGREHLVLDVENGNLLRSQDVCGKADYCQFDESAQTWKTEKDVSVKGGKRMPMTNQTNIVVGDWHYFLAHEILAIGRVHVISGKTEYLQLPAQIVSKTGSQKADLIWSKESAILNDTKNSRGIDNVTDKRTKGTGWGHVSAAMPTLVGRNLYVPVMNGTVYVIDAEAERLNENALVAVNDLGVAGETWSLSNFTYDSSTGRLYARTMKEVICIGKSE